MGQRIYVETMIRAPLARVWEAAMAPSAHQQWDMRFDQIEDLADTVHRGRRQFRYRTRLGCGMAIDGFGETKDTQATATGRQTSVLRFWSDDRKSLIREGVGYWKFTPAGGGVCFVTGYDYATRFGFMGRLLDRLIFRPLMGWATALSFDRLRLWLERGTAPILSLQLFWLFHLARWGLGLVWLYHGLVPKWLSPEAGEWALWEAAWGPSASLTGLRWLGLGEMLVGLVFLLPPVRRIPQTGPQATDVSWPARWAAWLTLFAMVPVTGVLCFTAPHTLAQPFNPLTFNLCVMLLAVVCLLGESHVPSAARCRRSRRIS